MITLKHSLTTWNTCSFSQTLCNEITNLGADSLPLYQCTTQGGIVDGSSISVSVINAAEKPASIQVKIGVFFTEIVGGCNCADDPVANNTYCELQVIINRSTAETDITIIHN